MIRSIFCASPGKRNAFRYRRIAVSRGSSVNWKNWVNSYSTYWLKSSESERYSPIANLDKPFVSSKNYATSLCFLIRSFWRQNYTPWFGFSLNIIIPVSRIFSSLLQPSLYAIKLAAKSGIRSLKDH